MPNILADVELRTNQQIEVFSIIIYANRVKLYRLYRVMKNDI